LVQSGLVRNQSDFLLIRPPFGQDLTAAEKFRHRVPTDGVRLPRANDAAGERFVESLLLHVSPHRFVRWVKLGIGMQPTDISLEQLKRLLAL
jgi:hypothetical protein